MKFVYFSITPNLHAARFEKSIILLDSVNDRYLSLIDEAARCFQVIVQQAFVQEGAAFSPVRDIGFDAESLNEWISYFREQKFIVPGESVNPSPITQGPLQKGGLLNYAWDTKSGWAPFSKTSKLQIAGAFFRLAKTHYTMKRRGIKGLLDQIQKAHSKCSECSIPTERERLELASAVDAASILFPRKSFCLSWAATYVILSLQRKWLAKVVLGIQVNPFYAHAWAETENGIVIHDDPQVAQRLSVILKTP